MQTERYTQAISRRKRPPVPSTASHTSYVREQIAVRLDENDKPTVSKPNETLEEWKHRMASLRSYTTYLWCPRCRQRAKPFVEDGVRRGHCSHCDWTWTRHKR